MWRSREPAALAVEGIRVVRNEKGSRVRVCRQQQTTGSGCRVSAKVLFAACASGSWWRVVMIRRASLVAIRSGC